MKFRYIRKFGKTGSLWPSSSVLACAMFDAASRFLDEHDEVIFAGIGNGAVAQLFTKLDKRVVFVDIDKEFCQRFRASVGPRHEVVCMDIVEHLECAVSDHMARRLIISCLPMRGVFRNEGLRRILLAQVEQGATVIFYSYFPHVAWTDSTRNQISRRAAIFRNVPPAFVYSLKAQA